jgi:predicted AAA+ superfamily ATPase
MKLTDNQTELFNAIESELRKKTALEYIKGGYSNGVAAYKAACKKLKKKQSKNPDTSSAEILNYPSVTRFIDSIRVIVAEKVQIDAVWVLEQAKKSYEINAKTFVNDASAEEMVNAGAAGKFLDMCGKHINVQAFVTNTKVEHSLTDDFESLMGDASSHD